jgi:DNA-binding SARP family transcriptional activator
MLVRLQVLGPATVSRGDGQGTSRVLTQPRHLATLAYLVLARPRGLHSRDTLVALLWPEADQAGARHALRNTLHRIRQALGETVIVTAGDGLVGVDRDQIICDAVTLEDDLAAGRLDDVVARYQGELLKGFHVSDAPEFERWLDGERRRLSDAVLGAAWTAAETLRKQGDLNGALKAARRAITIAPDDEPSIRRLMEMLDGGGDRAGALRAFEEFAERLNVDYQTAPSAETQALANKLRVSPPPHVRSTPVSRAARAAPLPSAPAVRSVDFRLRGAVLGGLVLLAILLPLAAWRATRKTSKEATSALGSGIPARYRADTALFQRYLRGEAQIKNGQLEEARRSFTQLVEDAPLYAPGWAGLGSVMHHSAFDEIRPSEALPRSVAAANRALSLDGTLVEAEGVLISHEMFGRWDLPAAKQRLDRALARHPDDAELLNILANWYRWRGDMPDELLLKRRALALDPLSPRFTRQLGWSLYLAHRCAEAADVYRRTAAMFPDPAIAHLGLYDSLRCLGRTDEAVVALRESFVESGDTVLARRLDPPLSPAGRDSALQVVFHAGVDRELALRRRKWGTAQKLAMAYAELRDADSTLIWLDSMYTERSMRLHTVPFDPVYDFLRSNPRFQRFLGQLPWKPKLLN